MARKRDLVVFQPPRNTVDCGMLDCRQQAICKIKIDGDFVNVCDWHYNDHFLQQARANCAARGLHTTDQLRAEFKATAAKLAQRLSNREFLKQREPGEDWTEDQTA